MAILSHGGLGRVGTEGRRRLDPYPDPGAAINALAVLLRAKRRRSQTRPNRAAAAVPSARAAGVRADANDTQVQLGAVGHAVAFAVFTNRSVRPTRRDKSS